MIFPKYYNDIEVYKSKFIDNSKEYKCILNSVI